MPAAAQAKWGRPPKDRGGSNTGAADGADAGQIHSAGSGDGGVGSAKQRQKWRDPMDGVTFVAKSQGVLHLGGRAERAEHEARITQ